VSSARRALASALAAAAALVLVSCGNASSIVALPSVDPAAPGTPTNPFPNVGASSTPSADPPPAEPDHLSVALAGDVLVHTGVWQTAQRDAARRGERLPDFRPMFAGVKDQIAPADLAICHMETPLSRPSGPYRNYPIFSAPPTVLDGIVATGFDGCTTASNHSVDQGFTGLVRTIDAFDRRDLAHTGTFATRRAARQPLVFDVHGVQVGLISMAFGTNGLPVTEPWSVNLIDVPKAIAQARAMHRHGVDIVMVAVHAGDEYSHAPSAQQVEVFHALLRSPYVDFVYGHHSHVVEPIDKVDGKWAVYGLGNFVAQQETEIPDTYRGVIAHVEFVEQPDGSYRAARPTYTPTVITDPHVYGATRVYDAPRLLTEPGAPASLKSLAAASIRSVRNIHARE
jgi:poly-gamma-glutamate synthesis protein (capsule biosynthesis protein)